MELYTTHYPGPKYLLNSSHASVVESIEFVSILLANFPTLRAIHQYRQHITFIIKHCGPYLPSHWPTAKFGNQRTLRQSRLSQIHG